MENPEVPQAMPEHLPMKLTEEQAQGKLTTEELEEHNKLVDELVLEDTNENNPKWSRWLELARKAE